MSSENQQRINRLRLENSCYGKMFFSKGGTMKKTVLFFFKFLLKVVACHFRARQPWTPTICDTHLLISVGGETIDGVQ